MQTIGDARIYLGLAIAGVIAPYAAFLPWIAEHGFAPGLLVQQAFATRIAAFAWLDVIVSALAVLSAAAFSMKGHRLALIVAACLLIGVSAALPAFFYFLAKDSAMSAARH